MALALLYDVHGNLAALEAVLADAAQRGVSRFLLGGDYALFGPAPAETLRRLRELDASWIRGNGERWSQTPADAPDDAVVQGAIEATRAALGERAVVELASLPAQLARDGTLYCHGSPLSDVRSFLPEPAPDEDELLRDVTEPRLVFGHTHLPFRRSSANGIELVNPGSVGMPFDGDPRAAYAVLDERGDVEHRRVAYDHAASAAQLREREPGSWAAVVAWRIENARYA
ncbi:MAG TPA: metallophosphoesterase family protein [Solirubrobacteraceae bacterium]|nr:metallophosphoesterase family protein [Solirubrobacteraceae bacterium]